jgi:peptidoglycan/xylan/chitin deacetylase (PgdA/CDA1 family)
MGRGYRASCFASKRALLLAALAVSAANAANAASRRPAREVAITVDDLPAVSVAGGGASASPREAEAAWREMTQRLLRALGRLKAPVVGFVNSSKLSVDGELAPARVDLLRRWLEAGFELGNHTASHADRHAVSLADFEADVERGEPVLRELLAGRSRGLRWFRHPYLHTGRSLEEKRALEEFLASRGYRVAPVTIDNSEWIFARAYASALDAGDATLARKVADAYGPYMESQFDYLERQSRALFGRDIRQVLLIHANSLNADRLPDLLERLRRRGYSFVTLDRALEDPAYASPDTFVGGGGITWLHRWALSSGARPLPGEPQPPDFVFRAARVEPGS